MKVHDIFVVRLLCWICTVDLSSSAFVQRDIAPLVLQPPRAASSPAVEPAQKSRTTESRIFPQKWGKPQMKPWQPKEQPDPGEGQWGPWSPWSQCNKNCEKFRTRRCEGVPRPEGVQCRGPYNLRNDCDPDVCKHMAGMEVPDPPEQKGAAFHMDGQLIYPHTGVPTHAINIFIRFKPQVNNAVIIERHPLETCHSQRCRNSIVLSIVKQKMELKVTIDGQKLRIIGKNKIKLNGWHTVIILVFHSKASLAVDNQAVLTASFKTSPSPVNLDQPMKVGFMGKRIVSMRQAMSQILGHVAELRVNYKSASLLSSVWNKGHLRPIREQRISHVKKETNSMYPPFAGQQFTSYPILDTQTAGKKLVFGILFSPRYDPKGAADREIVFFLPGRDDHSYVMISTTARKFYICVKRNKDEAIACSKGHQLKDGTCSLGIHLGETKLTARWRKTRKEGNVYEQSAALSVGANKWGPSDILYLGGLPTALWKVLNEEKNAKSLRWIGFTGYIYSVKINGKKLSLKKGTVYSKDGVINAYGATEADNYSEVPNTENAENVTLKCDYSQNVKQTDKVNVKWISGNKVVTPGRFKNLNITIQDNPVERLSFLQLKIIDANNTLKAQSARKDMEGFYACQLNRNENRFLLAAFGITNASSSDDYGAMTVWNMRVPGWMATIALRTGVSPKVVVAFTIAIAMIIVFGSIAVTMAYLYNNDPIFKQWIQEVSHGKIVNITKKSGEGGNKQEPGSGGGSTQNGRHRTELYHQPYKPGANPTSDGPQAGNVSTNCGTDFEGDFDDFSGYEVCATEMDGLLSDEVRSYYDESDASTYGSYSGTTESGDFEEDDVGRTYLEDDFSTDLNYTESNTTAGHTSYHTEHRHRHWRSRSRSLDRSRSRSRSPRRHRHRHRHGGRSRSREREHRCRRHRHHHDHHHHSRSHSLERHRHEVADVKTNVHMTRASPVGDASSQGLSKAKRCTTNIVNRKESPAAVVKQRNSATIINTSPKVANVQKPAATAAKQLSPPVKTPVSPRTSTAIKPAGTASTGVKVSSPQVPRTVITVTKQATQTVNNQNRATVVTSKAGSVQNTPTSATTAKPAAIRPAASTKPAAITKPTATTQPAATKPKLCTGALTAKTAVNPPASSPQTKNANQAIRNSTVRVPAENNPSHAINIHESPNDPNDYSWRNPSPPYGRKAGATNYVETFDEVAQNVPYYGQSSPIDRHYAESAPGYYGSDGSHASVQRQYAYPPSLGISRGCSSTSWLNTNDNARPQGNMNENARPESGDDTFSPAQAFVQGAYSPGGWESILDTPDQSVNVGELNEASPSIEDVSQRDNSSGYAPQPCQLPTQAFMEELLAKTKLLPSIEEE